MLDKLQSFFGFTRMPFGRDLAVGMLHRHSGHAETVARITWTITTRSLGVVTGEVGVGKTVSVRAALTGLDASRHHPIYIPNPHIGTRGIYQQIATSLGHTPRFHTGALLPQAAHALATEHAERGRVPVLVIDEAHLLSTNQLESLRMLTNFDLDSTTPFACLLIGQPTLRHMLKLGVLAALDQRVATKAHLAGMTPDETRGYLQHHLALAGRSDPLFTDDAAALIHECARGLPRSVNNIALQGLIATFAANKTIVDEAATRAAITEVTATT
jgi:type II secretory pathway predicted ATPase ExeA